jgi:glycosyltransferase involved in cell wall biosynthesis
MEERLHQWGLPPERIRLVRHFVPPVAGAAPGGGTFGVFAGRLSKEKGVDLLIRALKQAGDPPFRLLGDGPLADELKSLASGLGLQNLEFLGHLSVEQVQKTLSEARYAVLPSLFEETGGLAALEPLAAGRPVLVSRRGALNDLVSLGAAQGATPGSAEDLAAGIRLFVEDDDVCVRLGKRGLELAESLFSPAAHRANLEAAYQELVI